MDVRLGTSMGLNTTHVTHWTYEEVLPPEPPDPPVEDLEAGHLPGTDPTPDGYGEGVADTAELPATAPKPEAQSTQPEHPTEAPSTSLDPATAMAEREGIEPVGTLTIYFVGSTDPLVLTDDNAKAVLGVFVANSGSLI
jgi:hypothetical protein